WVSGTTYALGAYVSHEGVIYQSKAGSNLGHEPPNATWWTVVGTAMSRDDTLAGQVSDLDLQINADGTGILDRLDGVILLVEDPDTGNAALAARIDEVELTTGQKPYFYYQSTAPTSGSTPPPVAND